MWYWLWIINHSYQDQALPLLINTQFLLWSDVKWKISSHKLKLMKCFSYSVFLLCHHFCPNAGKMRTKSLLVIAHVMIYGISEFHNKGCTFYIWLTSNFPGLLVFSEIKFGNWLKRCLLKPKRNAIVQLQYCYLRKDSESLFRNSYQN